MRTQTCTAAKYESVLVLAFEKKSGSIDFSRRSFHTDVEVILINSPPPSVPLPGLQGTDISFDSWKMLGIDVNRLDGVQTYTTGKLKLTSCNHDILCIPLSAGESKAVIEFIDDIRNITYNHWDYIFSRNAALIPYGLFGDVVIDESLAFRDSVRYLHPAQLVVLLFRRCLDKNRTSVAKLWGFNSRLTTANDIFEQLRMACIAIDADALACHILRALYEGSSNVVHS
jgi:hypothetical protein